MLSQKPTLPYQTRKKLVHDVLNTMNFDMSRLEHVLPLFDIFQLPEVERPDNLKSLKEHIITWFAQKFPTIENIDQFLSIKYVPNDEVRSYAATLLYSYRQKTEEEMKKNIMTVPETYQPMPNYMGYPPPYPYMMGSPYMMNPPMYPHSQPQTQPQSQPQPQESYEKYYQQMGQMNPYYMPMGYPPQMYGPGAYSMPRGEMNPYRYPPYYPQYPQSEQKYPSQPPPRPTAEQTEHKPEEQPRKPRTRSTAQPSHTSQHQSNPPHQPNPTPQKSPNFPNYHIHAPGVIEQSSQPKKSDISVQEYQKNYEKFQEHEKNRYDREGPFKILLPEMKEKKKNNEGRPIQIVDQNYPEIIPQPYQHTPRDPIQNMPSPFQSIQPLPPKTPVDSTSFNFMREIDPLTPVLGVIKQSYIESIMKEDFFQQHDIQSMMESLNNYRKQGNHDDQYEVQIRCMKIKDASSGMLEYTWPDQTALFFDKEKICDFPALQYNSSLKKRKDHAIPLTSCLQSHYTKHRRSKSMKIVIGLQNRVIPVEDRNSKKIRNDCVFILGLYFVKKNTVDELYNSILSQHGNRVRFIENYFKEQALKDDEIKVEKIKISLLDPFSWTLIEVPARGKKCKHGQSFDLRKFIGFISVQKNKAWKCPVCSKSCREFVIDEQQLEVLQSFHEKKPSSENQQLSNEVTFTCDGKTLFKVDIQRQKDEEHNESQSVRFEKQKVKLIKNQKLVEENLKAAQQQNA